MTPLPPSCIFACSNSSSAVGWIHQLNFDPETQPIHKECSRHLTRLVIRYTSTLYSQYQRGVHSTIADIFSRWHFLTPVKLTISPHIAADEFSEPPSSTRDRLMGYLYVSEVERCSGITEDTNTKHELAWRRWLAYLGKVASKTTPTYLCFLGGEGAEKVRLVRGFTVSVRRGYHSTPRHEGPLVSITIKQSIGNLASTFTINDQPNSQRNHDGDIHTHL